MIKEHFVKNGINIKWWAGKHNLDYMTTFYVVNGTLNGSKRSNGKTKAVFKALKKEGIIKKMPKGLREEQKAS
ncbi:hypothetical protein [Campylobacter sp. RM16191]|uniref:hypothetical protein n=1 Tax=Campylobacter sp. RM16191 TaxID=1705728 RepID=UPI00147534DF|nr:hypothetical protein [Campylobacter sp. RM16191]